MILKGHISPETAYVVDDYPYGFRLRCKIRYWLDFHPKKGVRFVSQTTNPKRPGIVWNKEKASTYSFVAEAMYLDDDGHVKAAGLTEYTYGAEAQEWSDKWREGVPEAAQGRLDAWVITKLAYDARVAVSKERKALFEERANDKCGTQRCGADSKTCSCRAWVDERLPWPPRRAA